MGAYCSEGPYNRRPSSQTHKQAVTITSVTTTDDNNKVKISVINIKYLLVRINSRYPTAECVDEL